MSSRDELEITQLSAGVTQTAGSPAQFLSASRQRLSRSPDDKLQKVFLAFSLLAAKEYCEAMCLALEVTQPGTSSLHPPREVKELEALLEVTAAAKLARELLYETVKEYAGSEGANLTVDHWDKMIRELEADISSKQSDLR